MTRLTILLTVCLITSWQLNAQNCIDTAHVKGYYVIMRSANEINPQISRKKNVTILERPVDTQYDPSFIPCDSISKERPLSYWLNHFFGDTKRVFISCVKFGIKYFVAKECLPELGNENDSCSFPLLKSKVLYQTTNLHTGRVFEIYYLDAYWARTKIKKDSPEADIIPSKIAERSISESEFELYCFVRFDSLQTAPKMKDPYIKVWKK